MAENSGTYTCADYRAEMTLLHLNRRLNQENLSREERVAIEERIRILEAELGMD